MLMNDNGGAQNDNSVDASLKFSTNWAEHVRAHNNFLNQDKFLCTSFLFSLSKQKPQNHEAKDSGCLTSKVQDTSLQNMQINKAWKLLSSPLLTTRGYIKPGKSHPLSADACPPIPKFTRQGALQCSGVSRSYPQESHVMGSRSSFQGQACRVNESRTVLQEKNCSFSISKSQKDNKDSLSCGAVNDDDDNILESIDVDQIILNHYQSTPQQSSNRFPSAALHASECDFSDVENLPPELHVMCSHNIKLGACPDALDHLHSMKDSLIAVSNELIDNADDMSSEKIESIRQERCLLKKQILLLEKCLQSKTKDERKMQHFSASSASHMTHQYASPMLDPFRVEPRRLDPQFQSHAGSNEILRFDSSFASTYQMDGVGFSAASSEREPYIPKYVEVNYIDGSADKKWSSREFAWTKKIEDDNRKVFGNHSFRPNQREIINATMSGCDVFVLMPTGGGKSLTYQLPALACHGITLVISPLVSLIQDQIMHLLQANIPSTYLSASMEWSEQQEILRELNSDYCKYKLLYVTPEKVARSDSLLRQLENLYFREALSRIVIDEAHCVSQWGHDFRPDYQGLGILKQKFPTVPVLALTATATLSVKEDVVQALGLENCIVFRQSFNRPNLRYSVVPKTKSCLEDIHKFIRKNHFDESGIIYCLSRNDCEKVAEKLQEYGHKAAFYHGSMDPEQRAMIQKQWSKDEINIICATVAFGMGINKPDVRFVIHHSLPKSIEGYHQECGRAGRDGLPSSCVLYYSYADYIRVKHMISQGVTDQSSNTPGVYRASTPASGRLLETNTENLIRMVSYCENDVDCRRLLQLIHFGEKFDSLNCEKTCDNCCKNQKCIVKDVTLTAKQLVDLIKVTGQRFSASHLLEVFRGSLSQHVKKYRHETLSLHGAGKHLGKHEASRVMHHLVIEDILFEEVKKSDVYGSVSSVVKVNESKASSITHGNQTIKIRFPLSVEAPKKGSKATPAKNSLPVEKQSPLQVETPSQPHSAIDLSLSAKLYSRLRKLRSDLVKEAGEGVMAYHIFGNATLQQISKKIPRSKEELLEVHGIGKAKISKYGDRVLQTIEETITDHHREKNGSSSNDSTDSKRRKLAHATSCSMDETSNGDVDERQAKGSVQSRKRLVKETNSDTHMDIDASYTEQLLDIDFDDNVFNKEAV